MNKINQFRAFQALMAFTTIFEMYVAYLSPTRNDTAIFVVFALVSIATFILLNRRIASLKLKLD